MNQPSVRLITKCLSIEHLKSLNPSIDAFTPGQQLSVFRSNGEVEHDWVVVETFGSEILVSRLEKEYEPFTRGS